MRLTLKHIEFCRAIVEGMTLADAYRKIKPGCPDNSARSIGAQWNARPEIQSTIARLRNELACKSVLSIHEKRWALADIVRGKVEAKTSDIIKAIELDARLAGEFKDNEGGEKKKSSPKFGLSLTANNMQINNGVTTTKSTLPSPAKEAIGSDTPPPIIDITSTSTDIS